MAINLPKLSTGCLFINMQKVCSPSNYKRFVKIRDVAVASCPLHLTECVRQAGSGNG